MTIEHIKGDKTGYFKAIEDGIEAGRMTYYWKIEGQIIIDHTEVETSFGGRGIGKKLVLAGVDFARKNNIKIIPLCSFVSALFEKIEDLQDVKY